MGLGEIIERLREEIERDDSIRENILPKAREAVRKCSDAIKEVHRGNFNTAERLIEEAHRIVVSATEMADQSRFLSKSRILETAWQEIAEASNVLSLLRDGTYVPPEDLGIPTRPYLTGLADTVGELRRAALDALRNQELLRTEQLLSLMENILDELHGLDFPSALVPDLRRKCDVARGLVERTRGDVTLAHQQSRLVEELRKFEGRLKEGQE
ncbi:MAG: haloacid dehalogenase [Candidatus Thorarchaeota archaeon]|nr:MAG: haloacid dehalogenase [Candidatus Thorarchaeota archaeon]